jgi:phage regulator Rha-like protein
MITKTNGQHTNVNRHDTRLAGIARSEVSVVVTLINTTTEARIDTRLLAQQLGNNHKPVVALIDKYLNEFKAHGQVLFKKADGDRKQGGGKAERYALLNEDQSYFLLSLSRNNVTVVALKSKLVRAFSEARRGAQIRKLEYMPAYRLAHDQIKVLANGASNEHFDHMNLNRLLNKVVGVESGQRATAPEGKQALLTVGLLLANDAMQGAPDSKTAYQRAKEAVQPLQRLAIRSAS